VVPENETSSPKCQVLWTPQPGPQTAFLQAGNIYEVLYGGARAGGKSFSMLLDWMRHAQAYGKEANGLILRKELIQLKDLIKESIRVYTPLGWRWRESPKTWTTPEGAVLTFAYLESDQDAEKYQGWNLTWIGVEELTTFARPEPLFRLMATLRSPNPDLKVCCKAKTGVRCSTSCRTA
jgi:hypothetical protein